MIKAKVRPWYGHADHIHVRLKCPADSPVCRAHWFADWILRLKIPDMSGSAKGLMLRDLPAARGAVLNEPANPSSAEADERLEPR